MEGWKMRKSLSVAKVGFATLRDLSNRKQIRLISNSISRLKELKTTYDRPFLKPLTQRQQKVEVDEDPNISNNNHLFEPDFSARSRRLCEELIFHMGVFAKLFRESHRIKTLFLKLYGWDESFEELFFYPRREELRSDLSPGEIYTRLGFSGKSMKTRNIYNKLRLFLSQLQSFNRRKQEMQSQLMKGRLSLQLGKLEKQMGLFSQAKSSQPYLQEISEAHQLMLNNKLKIRNKQQNVTEVEQKLGGMTINQFYLREEAGLREVEEFFTAQRLGRTN